MTDCRLASSEQIDVTRDTFIICCPSCDQAFDLEAAAVIPAWAVVSLNVAGEVVYDNTNIIGITPYAVDATAGDTRVTVYRNGKFNEDLLELSAGTPDTVREDLSRVGILLGKVSA